MGCCDGLDVSWQARLRAGVVEYNRSSEPTPLAAYRQLTGLDGGDFSLGIAGGHADLAVDGGDLNDPQWQWSGSPLVADGGTWS